MPIYKLKGSKDGKQKYRVRVNFTDDMGKYGQIERIAYGKAEAKECERKLQNEINAKKTNSRLTISKLYTLYIESLSYEVRETSLQKTKTILQNHVIPKLGEVDIKKLNAAKILEWKKYINDKNFSIRTKQNIYSIFRAMINWGIKVDYISNNILTKVGNFKSTDELQKEMLFYTPEEYIRFAKAAEEYAENAATVYAWDFYVFFSIAFYTGLRKGEIHALKWSDIDGEYLSVTRSISQKLKGGDRETPPKNKSSIRTLQMPKPLIKILDKHKAKYMFDSNFSDDYRICGGTRPLRDTTIENMNKRFAEAAGLKKIRIHDFRHSHVSVLANNGINIQEVARRLGHSDVKMTWNTYAHLYPMEEERATQVLDKII